MFARNKARDGVVGVEMRDDAIALAHVTRRGEQPGDAVFDYCPVSGDAFGPALHDLVQRHGLKGADCVGVLPHGTYQLLQVEPPNVPDNEKRQAVKWRLRERIDYPVADAVVDVFDPPRHANRPVSSLNAVVCPAVVISRFVDVVSGAGLKLQALDIAELVQRNLLAALSGDDAVALLTFQARRGLITLVKSAELYLARDLDFGLEVIGDAVASAGDDGPAYESVVLELQRSLDYFESGFGMAAIKRVLVHPPADGIERLVAHVRTTLPSLDIEVFSPADLLGGGGTVPNGCLNAFGAALRDSQAAA